MRAIAGRLGVTQPVIYSVFASRQALLDAVALNGFADLTSWFGNVDRHPRAVMAAYLEFARENPRLYEVMFSSPTGAAFATADAPRAMRESFEIIRSAFPDENGTRAEVVWSTLHGLATLEDTGRLAAGHESERLDLAHEVLTSSGERV